MKIPVPFAVGAIGAVAAALARTWRFRGPPRCVSPGPAGLLADDPTTGPDADPDSLDGRLEHAVYALWHEHLLPLAVLHAHQGAAVLVSQHRDGEILARLMTRWGYLAARGSSTRGGEEGLRDMVRAAHAGRPIAFTPDGPRGPARRCKTGVVRAAAETGLPIVVVGVAASRARRLRSWDRFLVPLPGATIVVSYGAPIAVDGASEEDVALWTARVESALNREVERCETFAHDEA